MRKRLALLSAALLLTSSMIVTNAKAASNEKSLTKAQVQEIQIKKAQTENAMKNWNNLKSSQNNKASGITTLTTGPIGTGGDILVTLDGASSGSFAWAGGHAGLVENSTYVIEAFGNKGSSLNGVRRWSNNWTTRYVHFKGLKVNNATSTQYLNAKNIGVSHIGKPYNYNFFNITTTSSFYCSQLVWRAWYNQGYDLNDGGAVWPVDLIESPQTYAFYTQ